MFVATGVPSSYVHGSIIDGIFSGRIDLPTESYYVEKSEMYFTAAQPFHSVIYAGSDVAHDLPSRCQSLSTFCIYFGIPKMQFEVLMLASYSCNSADIRL